MPAGITRDTEISRNFDLLIIVYFMKILVSVLWKTFQMASQIGWAVKSAT